MQLKLLLEQIEIFRSDRSLYYLRHASSIDFSILIFVCILSVCACVSLDLKQIDFNLISKRV